MTAGSSQLILPLKATVADALFEGVAMVLGDFLMA